MRKNIFLFLLAVFPLLGFAEEEIDPPVAQENIPASDPMGAPILEQKNSSDGYDFSWLDPDKKIYVVQNRKYLKAERIEIGLNGGISYGEPYRTTYVFVPRLSYYFSESWGISLLGVMSSIKENDNFMSLKSVSTIIPNVRDTPNWYGASILWVPFYAKINIFNTLLYLDWQFEAGGAYVNSEIDLNTSSVGTSNVRPDNYMGAYFGTGQKFFLSRDWAMRFDFYGLYYSADEAKSGIYTGKKVMESNYYFTLGMSYTF